MGECRNSVCCTEKQYEVIRYKYVISYLLFSFATITIFCSYHGGIANGGLGNMTGSPGAGNCGNCHNGGSDTTFSTIRIRRKGDTTSSNITYYTINSLYTITIRGKHSQYDMFGFQTVVLDRNNNPVGNFLDFDNYSHGYPAIKSIYAENNTRIPKDTNGWFEVNFDWMAPSISSGELTLYGIVNAVNNNGQPSFDKTGQTMAVSMSDSTPLTIKNLSSIGNIAIYPCPANDGLCIQLPTMHNISSIHLETLGGKIVSKAIINSINKSSTNREYYINTAELTNGCYLVRFGTDSYSHTKKVIIEH